MTSGLFIWKDCNWKLRQRSCSFLNQYSPPRVQEWDWGARKDGEYGIGAVAIVNRNLYLRIRCWI